MSFPFTEILIIFLSSISSNAIVGIIFSFIPSAIFLDTSRSVFSFISFCPIISPLFFTPRRFLRCRALLRCFDLLPDDHRICQAIPEQESGTGRGHLNDIPGLALFDPVRLRQLDLHQVVAPPAGLHSFTRRPGAVTPVPTYCRATTFTRSSSARVRSSHLITTSSPSG